MKHNERLVYAPVSILRAFTALADEDGNYMRRDDGKWVMGNQTAVEDGYPTIDPENPGEHEYAVSDFDREVCKALNLAEILLKGGR